MNPLNDYMVAHFTHSDYEARTLNQAGRAEIRKFSDSPLSARGFILTMAGVMVAGAAFLQLFA